ncbi:MAG: DUF3105 domain-containing protein [Nitriliruptorales bacterium]
MSSSGKQSAKAQKRQEKKQRSREAKARKAEQRRRADRRQRLRRGARVGLILVGVVGLVGGLYLATSWDRLAAGRRLGDLVVKERFLGRAHSSPVTTDPAPTSGNHTAGAECGVRSAPVDPSVQIHTLEHGGVVFQYREDDIDPAAIERLEGLAPEFGSHVLVAPNPSVDAPIVATAWTRKMRLDEVDMEALRDFAIAFRGQGPESVRCPV